MCLNRSERTEWHAAGILMRTCQRLLPFMLGIFSLYDIIIREDLYRCSIPNSIACSSSSLPEGLAVVTAHILGEQTVVGTPVREPPVELSVRELLALDSFDNMVPSVFTFFMLLLSSFCHPCHHTCGCSLSQKKQFIVKVAITGLGSDNHWWFLSCRKCHKTAYISRRQYRCSDYGCSSVAADPS